MLTIAGEIHYEESEAAPIIGRKSRITLYRARQKGQISFYRIGGRPYYTMDQLRAYRDRHLIPATQPKEQTRRLEPQAV